MNLSVKKTFLNKRSEKLHGDVGSFELTESYLFDDIETSKIIIIIIK
jgi:hypothetical protein